MNRDERLGQFYNFNHEETDFLEDSKSFSWDPTERYSDFNEIGQGGMKTVFKAYDTHGERDIAYAKVRDDIPLKYRTAFVQEAKLTADLEHPNIITIHDIGLEKNGAPFFTMELKVGDSLMDILNQLKSKNVEYEKQYSLDQRLEIFLKVCDAIAFAHSKEIMHLDLKPENIQVGQFGEVLVCDWGLSKTFHEAEEEVRENIDLHEISPEGQATMYGQIKGTPGFMAPEQIDPEQAITHRSDIYALGTILYSLLCLEPPANGSMDEILKQTLTGSWDEPIQAREGISQSLNAVVIKAMALNPDDRYTNVDALKFDIQQYRLGFATQAENASTIKLFQLLFKRHQTLNVVILINLFIAIVGTVYFINEIKESEATAVRAQLKAEENLKLALEQEKLAFDATKSLYKEQINRRQNLFAWNDFNKFQVTLVKAINQLIGLSKAYPELIEVNAELGYLNFIRQDFKKSKSYFEKHLGEYEYMLEFLDDFEARKKRNSILPIDDFVELMQRIQPLKNLHFKLLFYYLSETNNPEHKRKATIAYLKLFNPNWSDIIFDYDEIGKTLKIGGNNLMSLSHKSNLPLAGLRFSSLDISGTDVSSLANFSQLMVRELRINETKITDPDEIGNLNLQFIRKVVLSKDQFGWVNLKEEYPGITFRNKFSE